MSLSSLAKEAEPSSQSGTCPPCDQTDPPWPWREVPNADEGQWAEDRAIEDGVAARPRTHTRGRERHSQAAAAVHDCRDGAEDPSLPDKRWPRIAVSRLSPEHIDDSSPRRQRRHGRSMSNLL